MVATTTRQSKKMKDALGGKARNTGFERNGVLLNNLYGINCAAACILDTFPIVREQDEKAHGRYLTKELILAYMNAVAASDFTTVVQL